MVGVAAVIDGGRAPGGSPSTVLDLAGSEPRLIREGPIPFDQLLAEGRSNKAVSALLGISVKTVETHRAAIMKKLGINSSAELVRYAIRNSVIEA